MRPAAKLAFMTICAIIYETKDQGVDNMATRNAKRNCAEDEQLDRAYRAATATRSKKEKSKKAPVRGNIIIICFALLLIGTAFLALNLTSCSNNSDLILDNVYVAGVNVGGMTQAEAVAAVSAATKNTYSKLTMSVTVLDSTVQIDPSVSDVSLNVRRAVRAAYKHGEEGHIVDVSPYLTLNEKAIREALNVLGEKYSSTLTDRKSVV